MGSATSSAMTPEDLKRPQLMVSASRRFTYVPATTKTPVGPPATRIGPPAVSEHGRISATALQNTGGGSPLSGHTTPTVRKIHQIFREIETLDFIS